jgi:hypothetical protein
LRQERWLEAIKLVLEFKAKLHAQEDARVASVMNKIASRPPEILLMIVEACVKPQLRQWSVQGSTDSTVLSRIATKCFSWPDGIVANMRDMLEVEASKALIKATIIKIPLVFTTQNTIEIPPMLRDRRNDLRHLALDLDTTP